MSKKELQKLELERDTLTNRGYMMLLEQIPLLAIPAFLAILVGRKLAPLVGVEEKYVLGVLLLVALTVSWKFIMYRLTKFNTQLREVSQKIRDLKAEAEAKKVNEPQ